MLSLSALVGEGQKPRNPAVLPVAPPKVSWLYKAGKRSFDLVCSALLLLPLTCTALALLVLNPFLNNGPLFFIQDRMGRDCRPFRAWKFRSMVPPGVARRGPFDPLEHDRITRLGRFLRKSRIDELPQIFNVLRGEMSLVGPRPDALDHAKVYVSQIAGYRERHAILPGISGFAQTEVGYVEGLEGVRHKVAADLFYLRHASLRFDLWIAWRTVQVVLLRKGA